MGKTVVAGRGMPGKENENYTLYDDGTFLIRGIRGSYVHMDKPYQGDDQKAKGLPGKYSIVVMMPKDTHDKAKRLIEREIEKVLQERNRGQDIDDVNKCLRDGDLKKSKPEQKGMWTLNLSESRQPILRGINNEKIDPQHMGERAIGDMFQSGYWYDILGSLWWQDHKTGGKKVNGNILAVKLSRKDETFGKGGITDDDVDDAFGVSGDVGGFDDDSGDL